MKFAVAVVSGMLAQAFAAPLKGQKSGGNSKQAAIHGRQHRSLNGKGDGKGAGSGGSAVCELEGKWTLNFVCHDGRVPGSYTIGPFKNNWVITKRGDGFYNLFGQRVSPANYVLDFNYTVQEMPGNPNRLVGAVSWVNYYPDPNAPNARPDDQVDGNQTGPFDYPPEKFPPLIQVSIDFDENCNWWFNFMAQRPREVPPFLVYQPPMHFCYADATPTEPSRRELQELPEPELRELRGMKNPKTLTIPTPEVKNLDFLGEYTAEVKCYVGDKEVETFEETHYISLLNNSSNTGTNLLSDPPAPFVGASEEPGRFFLFQRRRESPLFETIDIVQPNGLDRTIFYGSTMNVSGYNLEEGQPAFDDPDALYIPLITFEMYYDDLKYKGYDMVLFGQRPGFRGGPVTDDDAGVHVCKARAVKGKKNTGGSKMGGRGSKMGSKKSGKKSCPRMCNPAGHYNSTVDCRRYTNDVGVFDEDSMFVGLGNGFYKLTSERASENFLMETLLVEHPRTDGLYVGSAYMRNVNETYVDDEFPVYINMQVQFEDTCDSWEGILQGWRPGIVDDDTRDDVMHYCKFDSDRKTLSLSL